ncbi:MAG: cytochrome C oxidase subunit IV family protein [Luteibaculum sp.]
MDRDDIIEYAPDQVHGEEHGRKVRKKIVQVTLLLTVITAVEVLVGVFYGRGTVSDTAWFWIKVFYIVLTLVKAGYIVMSFMHLGDERKNAKKVILVPYTLFILYLIFIALQESTYINDMLTRYF